MKYPLLYLLILLSVSINTVFAAGNFRSIHGIYVNKLGEIFISDMASNQIKRIDAEGSMKVYAGSGKLGDRDGSLLEAEFNSPSGIVGDSLGNLYLADQRNHKIRKISAEGIVTTVAGTGLQGYRDGLVNEAMFNYPEDLEIAADGSILVTDKVNNLLRVIKDGQVSTLK